MSLHYLHPDAVALINSRAAALVLFVQMDYSTPVRFNSSKSNITFGGFTFLRAGSLGTIDKVTDTTGEVTGLRFSLSAVPSENVALALSEPARGKRCRLWLGIADPETRAVKGDRLMFDGELDQMPLQLKGEQSTIAVTAVHKGSVFARPRSFRYTDADQRHKAPGDTCGRFLVSQSQHRDVWPAASWGRK